MATNSEDWHGKRAGYQKHKCRCDACMEWNREHSRFHRKRDIDDVEHEPRMTTAERVAEIEWIRSTETVDNIATRLDWTDADAMFTTLNRAGYEKLVESLKLQRDAPKMTETATIGFYGQRLYFD